ncbi:MAG: alcohol dehydrogenase catalytic domain-containing protein [Erysipelotrichaceae bacterium]|nr:alcohol dehydrogenase catalytic domain-containing protein [Erysipelotrichaceae bacterium]
MKAAIYNGIKNVEIKELPDIQCGDNNVVIKNLYAGICGSDVGAYNHGGDAVFIFPGLEFGHEMVSEVVEVGKNVKDIQVGQRVFPIPSHIKKDMLRASTAGGFSEYVEIEDFELGKSAVLVPENVSDKVAALIEPFLIGVNAISPFKVEKGKKAVVYGAGPIGLTAAIALKYLGCEVVICDVINSRLEIAKGFGLHTCNTIEENYVEKCQAAIGGSMTVFGQPAIDADFYVDAAGNQAVMDLFFQGAKFGAECSSIAVHHRPVTLNLVPVTYNGLKVVGPVGSYHTNLPLTLEIFSSEQFDLEKMITHEYSHDQLIEALEQATRADEALKVVIKY